jgi:hypothetical protein
MRKGSIADVTTPDKATSDAEVVRVSLAHMAAGPPDNGVSHRQAVEALDRLVSDRDSWKRVALHYQSLLGERGLL